MYVSGTLKEEKGVFLKKNYFLDIYVSVFWRFYMYLFDI